MFEIPGSRKGYYQWDLNQRLYVRDSSCNEVHFCSEKHPESLTCLVQEESGKRYVQVPNILLQSCLPITAFAYVKGAEDAYTKHTLCIEVWERPKPDDYVYTETEVKTWESAVEYALQEAKESGAFKGDQGEKGDKGDTGEQGPQGEKGEKGDGFLTEADKLELAIHCSAEGICLDLKDASSLPLMGLQTFGWTEPDLTSAGAGSNIVVTAAGKNLLHSTAVTKTMNGITFTVNDDGSITLDGTATTAFQFVLNSALTMPKGKYILSGCPAGGSDTTYDLRYGTKGEYRDFGDGVQFELEDTSTAVAGIMIRSGAEFSGLTFYPMIRLETESDGYVPYAGQILEIATPNGLPGIPVTSGGNYTDASGQQHLAHIAGYERDGQIGELKTTGYIESYAGEEISGAYISSTGGLDIGASVRYALDTPVFVPYEESVQQQWKALRTQIPRTIIYNDSGVWMQVSYAADTKAYIDSKFAELAAAIVDNT